MHNDQALDQDRDNPKDPGLLMCLHTSEDSREDRATEWTDDPVVDDWAPEERDWPAQETSRKREDQAMDKEWPEDPDTGVDIDDSYDFVVKGGCGWKVEIIPGFFWHPSSAPNWFYRMMQRLLLGWKWIRR